MSDYTRGILRVVVAQICQTIGWHSINSTPLEFMVDLMQEYFLRIYRLSHQYSEILGRTEVNLDDLGLAFQHLNIDIEQLSEYVRNVDSVPCVISVPKYPIPRENHLNFLKPGSREVVTRPVHIHEHLPAMHPDDEILSDKEPEPPTESPVDGSTITPGAEPSTPLNQSPEIIFKRPGDPLSETSPLGKRTRMDNESRPLREIHSVMMTTSGFLSPAREGKLPEPRTPIQARADSPPPATYPMVPPELKTEKKIKKVIKKNLDDKKIDKENKKKNRKQDELFKVDKITEPKVKKLAGMKETAKLKPLKSGGGKGFSPSTSPTPVHSLQKEDSPSKIKNNLSKVKNEKIAIPLMSDKKEENVDKLTSEPDKQKLNIFKKISKPRDDKSTDVGDVHKYKDVESRDNSPGLIIDVDDKHGRDSEGRREEKKVPNTPDGHGHGDSEIVDLRSPTSDVYMFDDMSPPGTPSTPKTPELNVPGPVVETKKKRKEKSSKKKDSLKSPGFKETPQKKVVHDMAEEILGRPKTPEALETCPPRDRSIPPNFPYFPPFPPAPGLIPTGPLIPPGPGLIPHGLPPMFTRFPLSLGRGLPTPPPIIQHLPMPRTPFLPPPPPMKIPPPRFDSFPGPGPSHLPTPMKMEKLEKIDKLDKRAKKHKIDKKDKIKKKKDKKEKHKEKLEKSKEKKEKLEKIKEKKDKKDKRKEKEDKEKEKEDEKESESVPKLKLKLGKASPRPLTPDNPSTKRILIKPLVKKPEDIKRESSPELAKISALVTRPPKPKTPKIKAEKREEVKEHPPIILSERPVATIVDDTGHQVWICPGCGNQDDGSPMIGCDDCDAWYHWVCVGMQIPPADDVPWYCRMCITKKQELHHDKKKNKRKKKVKIAV